MLQAQTQKLRLLIVKCYGSHFVLDGSKVCYCAQKVTVAFSAALVTKSDVEKIYLVKKRVSRGL